MKTKHSQSLSEEQLKIIEDTILYRAPDGGVVRQISYLENIVFFPNISNNPMFFLQPSEDNKL